MTFLGLKKSLDCAKRQECALEHDVEGGGCKTPMKTLQQRSCPRKRGVSGGCKTLAARAVPQAVPRKHGIFGGCKTALGNVSAGDVSWIHDIFSGCKTRPTRRAAKMTPWRHDVFGGCKTHKRRRGGQRGPWRHDVFGGCKTDTRACAGEVGCSSPFVGGKSTERTAGAQVSYRFFRKAGCRPHRVLRCLRGAAADSRVKVSGGCGRPLSPAHCTKPGAIAPGRREVSAATGRGETRQGEDDGWGRSALWRAAPPSIAGSRGVLAAGYGWEGKDDMDARVCAGRRREARLRGCGCGMMGARQPGLRGDPADAP